MEEELNPWRSKDQPDAGIANDEFNREVQLPSLPPRQLPPRPSVVENDTDDFGESRPRSLAQRHSSNSQFHSAHHVDSQQNSSRGFSREPSPSTGPPPDYEHEKNYESVLEPAKVEHVSELQTVLPSSAELLMAVNQPPPLPSKEVYSSQRNASSADAMGKGKKTFLSKTGRGKSQQLMEFDSITDGLRKLYKDKIRPLEAAYQYETFHSPMLTDADIRAKPMVLLLGQYSVGKTTFINYLLESKRGYPGSHIGPEPTTDRFVAVMHNDEDRVIPGNAAAVSPELPFTATQRFGTSFLSRFQVSQADVPLLEHITIIDTPGVLSGEKQSIGRGYDFISVIEFFAERSDLILLLFDAHKLDISDEFKAAIQTLKGLEDKVRVVLNKADQINFQSLMRVYGALNWGLARVVSTPEVMRVYIGSFWDEPFRFNDCASLLHAEQADLLEHLRALPRNSALRKINDIVRRARLARVHGLIISTLKDEMPALFGKQKKQAKLIDRLPEIFKKVGLQYGISPGDFPPVEKFRERLKAMKFVDFKNYEKKYFKMVDEVLAVDLPRLMEAFPQTNSVIPEASRNPFEEGGQPQLQPQQIADKIWLWENVNRSKYKPIFQSFNPLDNKVSGSKIKPYLDQQDVEKALLAHIWKLSDWSADGYLDFDEFVVCMHLVSIAKHNPNALPATLPTSLKPPLRRV